MIREQRILPSLHSSASIAQLKWLLVKSICDLICFFWLELHSAWDDFTPDMWTRPEISFHGDTQTYIALHNAFLCDVLSSSASLGTNERHSCLFHFMLFVGIIIRLNWFIIKNSLYFWLNTVVSHIIQESRLPPFRCICNHFCQKFIRSNSTNHYHLSCETPAQHFI